MSLEDERLIGLFLKRDESAPELAEKAYGSYCFKVAKGILGSANDAEECVNDTWMRAWEAIPPLNPKRPRQFFAQITRRLALDRLDRSRAGKRGSGEFELILSELSAEIPDNNEPSSEAELRELADSINAFLRRIPEKHADVFIRRCFYMEPVKDIAERYGFTPGYTALILSRTRKKLKEHLIREEFIYE